MKKNQDYVKVSSRHQNFFWDIFFKNILDFYPYWKGILSYSIFVRNRKVPPSLNPAIQALKIVFMSQKFIA
jgi:hypothetical protein